MREAIAKRGLDHLVSKDGHQAVDRIVKEAEGKNTKRDYDPLMGLNWMIFGRALECGGLYLMGTQPDGSPYCPLCEAGVHGVVAQEWVDGASDAVLEYCKVNGLQG